MTTIDGHNVQLVYFSLNDLNLILNSYFTDYNFKIITKFEVNYHMQLLCDACLESLFVIINNINILSMVFHA